MHGLQIAEVERLLHGLVRICTVTEHGDGGKVKVTDGELNSTWLDRGVSRAGENCDWNPLDINEQVVVLCPSGDFAQGIIICSLYQEAHPANADDLEEERKTFKDGSVVSYNRESHRYLIDIKGADGTVDVVSAGTLNITTTKDIKVNTSANAKVIADGNVDVEGRRIGLNGGAPVVTVAHVCSFTGLPHSDGSTTVTSGE